MSDRDALLAAITADPDDDTPRLVYADWLDEHDEGDRAEYIRAQCRLAHISPRTAEGKRLAKRANELHPKLFEPTRHASELRTLGFTVLGFRRGFVSTVESGLLDFRDNAAALNATVAPAYEWVYREDRRDEEEFEADPGDPQEARNGAINEAFGCPELRRCVALDLPGLGSGGAAFALASEHLVNLRRLNFPCNEAGSNIEAVASPTFANLRWANFNDSSSDGVGPSIVPLAECPHLANLEHLDFGQCWLQDHDAEAVADAKHWDRLRYLNLCGSAFTLDGINVLAHTRRLPALAELDLAYTFNKYGSTLNADEYAADLADSPLFARLSKLWLQGNDINDEAAKALAASPREVKLTRLDLSHNPIGAAGKKALRKRFGKDVCVFGA